MRTPYAPPTLPDLHLQTWRETHEPELCEAFQDEELQRMLPVPVPYTRGSARTFVTEIAPRFLAEGGANFALVEEEALVGGTSLRIVDPGAGVGRLGYWVAPSQRGRGAARCSVELMKDWAARRGLQELELTVAEDNRPSLKVAIRSGFETVQRIEAHTFANGTTAPTLRLRCSLTR